jgi:hypothetical protein
LSVAFAGDWRVARAAAGFPAARAFDPEKYAQIEMVLKL